MERVKSLAPFLSKLQPADIEAFLDLWPTIKGHLFAQVLLAWVKEPFAVGYLAERLKPDAAPEVAYNMLLEACHAIPSQTPDSLITVTKDLSRQGVARTTGLLAAMVGMGIIQGPLSSTATTQVQAAPQKRTLKRRVASAHGVQQQAGDTHDLTIITSRCVVGLAFLISRSQQLLAAASHIRSLNPRQPPSNCRPATAAQQQQTVSGVPWQARQAAGKRGIGRKSKATTVKARIAVEPSHKIYKVALSNVASVTTQPTQPSLSWHGRLSRLAGLLEPHPQPLPVPLAPVPLPPVARQATLRCQELCHRHSEVSGMTKPTLHNCHNHPRSAHNFTNTCNTIPSDCYSNTLRSPTFTIAKPQHC